MTDWISVEDRLPDDFESVLAFRPNAVFDAMRVQMFKNGKFNGLYKVTYWQPLPPEPPQ